ncbi:MAG: urease accessory protein UreD [Acidobacteriota bacterium]|nr:urease accessory protein UreD [Acidobacteriota bacterium]
MHLDAQQPPWRVIRAFTQDDGGSLVHLHNVSGGVLSGDHLTLRIDAGSASVAQITTTGATRLYRHRPGSTDSQQHVKIDVGEGALLEYLPDVLIPFAGSRHLQSTSISLAKGATLFAWDVLAPGRQAMGETFAFDSLRIRTELRSGERPLLLENLVLDPANRPLDSAARLGRYTHIANFYACSVGLPVAKWRELESKLNEFCSARSKPGVIIWGASTLVAEGIAVRGLSLTARDVPATLAAIWSIAKRFLTGEDAILPRKVY